MERGGTQADRAPREVGEVITGGSTLHWGRNVPWHREENRADEKREIKSEVALPGSQMLQGMLGFS